MLVRAIYSPCCFVKSAGEEPACLSLARNMYESIYTQTFTYVYTHIHVHTYVYLSDNDVDPDSILKLWWANCI